MSAAACALVLAAPSALLAADSAASAPVAPTPAKPAASAAAAPVSDQAAKAPVENAAAPAAKSDEGEVFVMSPFEVTAEQDKGYLASSTMSGTRLNSKLEDLAASITVVTKQQLMDTAAVDINDVFMYEGNTEGIYQFTDFTLDRDVVIDNVSKNPNGANRVRGLGAANVAVGGYGVSGNVPIDTYNIDSIEISRGPNSTLFGLGNTSGGVNVIAGAANLTRSTTSVSARVDSSGGYRGTLNVNRPLLQGVLALRVDALYEDKGFERKPSADKTNRATLSLTAKPFARTQLKASYESYHNFNRRPNSTTPRDLVSEWKAQGRPVWNPQTFVVRFLDGGRAPIQMSTSTNTATILADETANLPTSILLSDTGFQARPGQRIDNGVVELYQVNRMPGAGTSGPNQIGGAGRMMQTSTAIVRNVAVLPLFVSPGVTDQSIYDWTKVNINSPNWAKSKTDTIRVELEQYFIQSPETTLAFQGGMYREESDTTARYFLANSDGGKSQIFVDINETLLDGKPNPYFLRPYVGGSQPTYYQKPERNENYRGTLALLQDFAKRDGWQKWLGRHNVAGYAEYRKVESTTGQGYLYRERVTQASFVTPANLTSGNGANVYPMYYVGDANGSNVDYGAAGRVAVDGGRYDMQWYNAITNTWVTENVGTEMLWVGNQTYRSERRTLGAAWQGYFLKDRIIPTVGIRKDNNRDHRSQGASVGADGRLDPRFRNVWSVPWDDKYGTTRSQGVVVKPLSWLTLHYNQSDSFIPATVAYNIYGGVLPNPTGKGKDYGFSVSLLDGKLVMKVNKYQTDEKQKRGTLGTIMNRVVRLDFDNNATGGDPDLYTFLSTEYLKINPAYTTDQIDTLAAKDMGLSTARFRELLALGGNINDTNTATSKGHEIEIYYNPDKYFTLKANITQQQAIDSDLSPIAQQWISERMPIWTTVKSPVDGHAYWNSTYVVGSRTPQQWFELNVLKDLKLATALQGKAKPQTREWRVNVNSTYRLAGITNHKWLKALDVGGALRWEDKGAIGFFGAAPDTDGAIRSLDADRPVWDQARFYFDLNAGYSFRFANDKIKGRVQLNVRNLFESGRLQPVAVNPDGTPWAFRIIDPRQFILTTSFDL